MEIVRKRVEERARVIEEARKWASKLKFKTSVTLVGSYARGNFNLWSDVDLVVVSDELQGTPLERLRGLDAPPGYEVIAWTVNEFKTMLAKKNPIALETLNGVVLRDDYKIFEKAS